MLLTEFVIDGTGGGGGGGGGIPPLLLFVKTDEIGGGGGGGPAGAKTVELRFLGAQTLCSLRSTDDAAVRTFDAIQIYEKILIPSKILDFVSIFEKLVYVLYPVALLEFFPCCCYYFLEFYFYWA